VNCDAIRDVDVIIKGSTRHTTHDTRLNKREFVPNDK